MSKTGDALRSATNTMPGALASALDVAPAEGQPVSTQNKINALLLAENGGGGATGVYNQIQSLIAEADSNELTPQPQGDGN